MIINGATIYNEGVSLGHDGDKKIHQIMTTLKSLSKSSNVSMRFLKSGNQYEALVWGKANGNMRSNNSSTYSDTPVALTA
ncbi:MAG: hypothetical protein C5B49_15055 [Bdellovibrio sp.]|nr:MAG: hypothetical protein C5B49_15055 [Bdellovibrio sp.]